MNTATRLKLTSPTVADSPNACWETPPLVFEKLNNDFGPFDFDLTASASNKLCDLHFGPGSEINENALAVPYWCDYGMSGYSNPPYGRFVATFLQKVEREYREGFDSTLLLPVRITKAFTTIILQRATHIYFCDKRICFYEGGTPRLNAKTGRPDPAVFDSMVVRFAGPQVSHPYVDVWKVPKHV